MSQVESPNLSLYRPNVGVVVFRADGLAWLGRRAGTEGPFNWQFPQGGVDKDEKLEDAARRELKEETGIASVSLLARTEGWIIYDFPEGHGGTKQARGWKGQRQVWFAFRFEGEDGEVDLEADAGEEGDVEFDSWRWAPLEEALEHVIPFKREAYEKVIAAFSRYAR
jgi:putative (di)nucleoside polyphosphate hydrolase